MTQPTSKCSRDNRANQLNAIHPVYYRSRGASSNEAQSRAEQRQSILNKQATKHRHDRHGSGGAE